LVLTGEWTGTTDGESHEIAKLLVRLAKKIQILVILGTESQTAPFRSLGVPILQVGRRKWTRRVPRADASQPATIDVEPSTGPVELPLPDQIAAIVRTGIHPGDGFHQTTIVEFDDIVTGTPTIRSKVVETTAHPGR
jgi:hypothetical protein